MFVYDKTFDPKLVVGHCDLKSWFSDFALYLGTQLVYVTPMGGLPLLRQGEHDRHMYQPGFKPATP